MKNLLILTVFLFMFACAMNISQEKFTDSELIDASKNEDILIEKGVIKDSSFIADKYPISGEVEVLSYQTKVLTPRPKQLFSAASSSEIRLHKLGEIRWVYLGLEPSAAWPMTIEFLKGDEYKIQYVNIHGREPTDDDIHDKFDSVLGEEAVAKVIQNKVISNQVNVNVLT